MSFMLIFEVVAGSNLDSIQDEITITDCWMQMYSDCYRPITRPILAVWSGLINVQHYAHSAPRRVPLLHVFWIIINLRKVALFSRLMCLCASLGGGLRCAWQS